MSPALSSWSVDVLVVGAGIAGVAIATGLARAGHDVLLVEQREDPPSALRGEYLQPRGVALAHKLGLAAVFKDACPIDEVHFRDIGAHDRVLAEIVVPYPPGTHALGLSHGLLTKRLWQHASDSLGPRFRRGAKLRPSQGAKAGSRPSFLLQQGDSEALLEPRWVVGCDGRAGTVRSWATGARPPRPMHTVLGASLELLVGVETRRPANLPRRYTVMRANGLGTVSSFAIGADRARVYWNSGPAPGHHGAMGPLSVGPRDPLRRRCAEGLAHAVRSVRSLHDFGEPLSDIGVGTAETIWHGGALAGPFVFAGDAAAVTTALGGQGMTNALENAADFLDTIDVRESRTPAVDAAKRRYSARARAAFRRVDVINICLFYLFFSRSKRLPAVTAQVLRQWEQEPAVMERVIREFGGLDLDRVGVLDLLRISGLISPFRFVSSLVAKGFQR